MKDRMNTKWNKERLSKREASILQESNPRTPHKRWSSKICKKTKEPHAFEEVKLPRRKRPSITGEWYSFTTNSKEEYRWHLFICRDCKKEKSKIEYRIKK